MQGSQREVVERAGSGRKRITSRKPEAVRMLGGFSVSVGSRVLEESCWRLKKAAGLVKLLALSPEHCLHRERLMDLLWPDLGEKAAANNLRHALHVARRILEPAPGTAPCHLRLQGEQIALCPEGPLWVDVEAFEEAAATARRAHEPAAYRAAVDLYAGELLPGDLYEGWTEERRWELRGKYLALLLELAGLHEKRGELEAAAGALEEAVAAEPAREEAHAGLMRLYATSGRKRQYVEDGRERAAARCLEVLSYGGMGHTAGIHARSRRAAVAFGEVMPVSRVIVNTSTTHGALGLSTALSPSLTLGCGSHGNNVTSDNVSPLHLLDIKWVAFETQPIEASVPALTGAAWEPRLVA